MISPRRAGYTAAFAFAMHMMSAATAPAQTASPATPRPPPYQPLRYNEDYRYLLDPTRRTDMWDPLKYIPLGDNPDAYLSVEGEIRERGEALNAPNFGIRHTPSNSYLLHHLLLSADLHLGRYARVFVQLGNELEAGKNKPISSVDVNRLDLQQTFFDLLLPVGEEPAHYL